MNFPGSNKITLTDAALMAAVEGAINAQRRDGEDYVYVTEVGRTGYGYGDWELKITTDKPTAEVVSITDQVAA